MKTATHLLITSQKTRCQTRLNVTKCHACHAKRSNATCETLSDPYGCGRLRTVRRRRANTPSASRPPEWKREPLLRIREKHGKTQPAAQKSRTQQTEETHKNKIPIPALSTFLAPPATQLTYKAWQQSTCRAVQTPSRSITPLDAQTSGRPLPDPVEKTYWH
jgi:hypothetical protein